MPGHRVACILATGVALTTVGCSALAPASRHASAGSSLPALATASHAADGESLTPATPAAVGTSATGQTVVVGSTAALDHGTPPATPRASWPAVRPSDLPNADPALEAVLTGLPGSAPYLPSWPATDAPCCSEIGLMSLPGPAPAFAEYLGASPDRMTVAVGTFGSGTRVPALRVRNADAAGFVEAWLALVDAGWRLPIEGPGYAIPGATTAPVASYPRPTTWQLDVARKRVTGLFAPEGMSGADMSSSCMRTRTCCSL